MNLNIGTLQKILFTGFINKFTRNDRRILLCPGNDVHFGIWLTIQGFGQRGIVVGDTSFEFWPGAEADDFHVVRCGVDLVIW